mmetsp:Transcript_40242/g.106574  ORF Transcript_40242/g.106574 Transcript_40242/m.106574 type:complete len:112 (-) Transcript_40242:236-571(-)
MHATRVNATPDDARFMRCASDRVLLIYDHHEAVPMGEAADKQREISEQVAGELGINPASVNLAVTAASVVLSFTLSLASSDDLDTRQQTGQSFRCLCLASRNISIDRVRRS